jgi:murein DD-endopeptidase MepM/ murein hydrolase activator NlpD
VKGAKGIALGCALALTFAQSAFAAGKEDALANGKAGDAEKSAPPLWSVTASATTAPGDCLAVVFQADHPIETANAEILDGEGKTVARGTAFEVKSSADPETPFRRVALIGLSSLLEPGAYTVRARATLLDQAKPELEAESPLTIEPKEFVSETIDLNESNTAIKTDDSPERAAQIKKLNDILFSLDESAPRFAGPFRASLDSKRRTAFFGDRRTYRYHNGKKEKSLHYGVDFGVPVGTPVFASGDGLVVMAEKRISTGWTVVVEHFPGVFSLYYHLDALCASEGELVRAGTLIGRSGQSGLATGPHLHWEFRVGGEAVSPDFFVGRTLF